MQEKETSALLNTLTSYWTDRARSYSAQNIAEMNDWRRKAWRELILSHAPQKNRLRILDVGTGPGFFAINLSLAGHEVTAVDITEHMLLHAKTSAESYGAQVNFVLHRGEFLPFADNSFDLVVSRNVVWNLEYPEQALSEWKRVLAPGGRMVYFDANWYLYLYDDQLRAEKEAAHAAFHAKHILHHHAGDLPPQRVAELEQAAYALPLSQARRPAWDCAVLQELGMEVKKILDDIGPGVQDPLDRERDAPIRTFMICAEKPLQEQQPHTRHQSLRAEPAAVGGIG